jgi:hypothetical protein
MAPGPAAAAPAAAAAAAATAFSNGGSRGDGTLRSGSGRREQQQQRRSTAATQRMGGSRALIPSGGGEAVGLIWEPLGSGASAPRGLITPRAPSDACALRGLLHGRPLLPPLHACPCGAQGPSAGHRTWRACPLAGARSRARSELGERARGTLGPRADGRAGVGLIPDSRVLRACPHGQVLCHCPSRRHPVRRVCLERPETSSGSAAGSGQLGRPC